MVAGAEAHSSAMNTDIRCDEWSGRKATNPQLIKGSLTMFMFNTNTAVKTTKAATINNVAKHEGVVFEGTETI